MSGTEWFCGVQLGGVKLPAEFPAARNSKSMVHAGSGRWRQKNGRPMLSVGSRLAVYRMAVVLRILNRIVYVIPADHSDIKWQCCCGKLFILIVHITSIDLPNYFSLLSNIAVLATHIHPISSSSRPERGNTYSNSTIMTHIRTTPF